MEAAGFCDISAPIYQDQRVIITLMKIRFAQKAGTLLNS
jgi:hypothetical protein